SPHSPVLELQLRSPELDTQDVFRFLEDEDVKFPAPYSGDVPTIPCSPPPRLLHISELSMPNTQDALQTLENMFAHTPTAFTPVGSPASLKPAAMATCIKAQVTVQIPRDGFILTWPCPRPTMYTAGAAIVEDLWSPLAHVVLIKIVTCVWLQSNGFLVHPAKSSLKSLLHRDSVEQEMLEHGTLTESDLQLDGPSVFGEGIYSPEALLMHTDHYSHLNCATAAAARPLTPHEAHHLPRDDPTLLSPDEVLKSLEQFAAVLGLNQDGSEENEHDEDEPSLGPIPPVDPQARMYAPDEDEDYEDGDTEERQQLDNQDKTTAGSGSTEGDPPGLSQEWRETERPGVNDRWDTLMDDIPDPFVAENPMQRSSNDLRDIPAYLLCIYAVASWTHLNFSLPVVAVNTLLWCFAVVLALIAPGASLPYLTLKTLVDILAVEGMEDLMDGWRKLARKPGFYRDIFDGAIAKGLLGPDGKPFFSNDISDRDKGPNGELRIALEWGVDWFSYLRSQIAPSHSSCPTSFSICNLPPEFRYRTANLMVTSILPGPKEQTSILPGPKEQTSDELQRFLRPIVSDLLRLWKQGIVIKTPGSPNEWIKQQDKATPESFQRGGAKYAALSSDHAREQFVKEFATRYTELSRLPYFNIIRQVVIDPMHNLFLGLVKTHFYHIWVQMKILREKHELRVLHEMLQDFVIPTSSGKLPKDIGTPAGGSLTADQWRLLLIIQGPIIIPQLWRACLPENPEKALQDRVARIAAEEAKKAEDRKKAKAAKDKKKAEKDAEKDKKKADKAKKKADKDAAKNSKKRKVTVDNELLEQHEERPSGSALPPTSDLPAVESSNAEPDQVNTTTKKDEPYALHPDDPKNFLKLSEALRILMDDILTSADIDHADRLLREYNTELITLYGASCIRPNHHYSIHTADFVRDFGPLHDFWSFLFERLNKLLKSYNTNNHGDGALETTFFAEFHRTSASSRVVTLMAHQMPDQPLVQRLGQVMLKATHDARGTVAGLASWAKETDKDLDQAHEIKKFSSETYRILLRFLQQRYPDWHLHSMLGKAHFADSQPMHNIGVFFDYVVVGGKRYYASGKTGTRHSSYVEVYSSFASSNPSTCGELLEVFQFQQNPTMQPLWYGRIRWFKPWNGPREDIWTYFTRLDVRLWYLEEYQPLDTVCAIISLQDIKGYLGLKTVTVRPNNQKVWATISLDHVCVLD
ncbi:hypothetical protein B0H21DRAFT_712451, partial [Amylocystis lapponica]